MAKTSGLGDNLYVGGYDLSGDINALDMISGPISALDFTAINGSAYERQGGERDGQIDFTAFHNTAANQEHARLSLLPTTDTLLTYARGTTLGNPAACLMAKQINYDPTRGTDGALTFKVSAQGNAFGLEWGTQLTAGKRSDVAATNGTGVDITGGVTYAFGFQAYLQVFSFTGTSATIKIQSSTDDGGGDAYSDVAGASFGAQSAIGFSRIATAVLTIERFLRVVTTGTFSQCTFSVVVVPNLTSVVF
jgi:hypothetical protein